MATNRKDVYSGMVTGQIESFGRVSREKDIVASPMRSGSKKKKRTYTKPKRATGSSWPGVEKTKSVGMSDLKQKSFERSLQKRLDSIDDDVLDVLFPEGNTKSIDKFIAGLDEKWLFDGIGGYIRRALKNRRRGKRKARKAKSDFGSQIVTKAKTGPCWAGYEQIGIKKGKGGKMVPNCVPIGKKSLDKPRLRDPNGGLTAAGRAHFKRTEGSNLKPGVKGAADTPEKMRRKGSFLTRFFTNPSGPMVGDDGKPTRLALSAAAWGEPVPKNRSDAAKLAAKGRRLLERYENTKKKDDFFSLEEKQLPGQTVGQQSGGSIGGSSSSEGIDHDGDGMIFDGTPQETRKPYERSKDANYEKQRRKFVREQLRRQGIKANRRVEDRSKEERDARARARAAFDKVLRDGQGKPVADGLPKGPKYPPGQSVPKKYPPGQKPPYKKPEKPRDFKPADRYPNPEKKYPPGQKPSPTKPSDRRPADRYPNPTRPDRKPADRYPEPARPIRPEDGVNNRPKPSPRSPSATRPGADRSEPRTSPSATRPGADRSEPRQSDRKPADRYPDAPRGIRPEDGVNNRPKPSVPKRTPGNNGLRKS